MDTAKAEEKAKTFTYNEVISIALKTDKSLRDRALFVVEYLSNSRVSEIVRRLRKNQISITEHKGVKFLMFTELHTEKNKQHPLRNIPINIEKEKTLVNILLEYIIPFQDNDVLFDISRVHAWRLMKALHGHTNHFQRHTRITHLITIYQLNDASIVKMAGWADPSMMKTYAHLVWQDIAGMMI